MRTTPVNKFIVGDELRLVKPHDALCISEVYVVREVHGTGAYILLEDVMRGRFFPVDLFTLAQPRIAPPVFKENGNLTGILYERASTFRIGSVRKSILGNVSIYLTASYWPDDKRQGRTGEQYMGDFNSFEGFRNSGSFDDLEYQPI